MSDSKPRNLERSESKYRDPLLGRLLALRLARDQPEVARRMTWPPLAGPGMRPLRTGLLEADEAGANRVLGAREIWVRTVADLGLSFKGGPTRILGDSSRDNAGVLDLVQVAVGRGLRTHVIDREAMADAGLSGLAAVVDEDVLWLDVRAFCRAADRFLTERGWSVKVRRSPLPRWLEHWIWPERRDQDQWVCIRRVDQRRTRFLSGEWMYAEVDEELAWIGPWHGPIPWAVVRARFGEGRRVVCPGRDLVDALLELDDG